MKRGHSETPTLALSSREQKETYRRLQVDSNPSGGWSEPPSKQGPLLPPSSVNTPARSLSRPYNLSTHLPPHSPALGPLLKTQLREATADLGSPASEQVLEDSDTSQEPQRRRILTEKVPFLVSLVLEGKCSHCDAPSPMLNLSRPAPALRLAPLTQNQRLAQSSPSGTIPVCHPTSGTRCAHTLQTLIQEV